MHDADRAWRFLLSSFLFWFWVLGSWSLKHFRHVERAGIMGIFQDQVFFFLFFSQLSTLELCFN